METLELTYLPHQIEIFFNNSQHKYLVVPKGRRTGITEGAEKAFIEYALDGISPLLWVDTINGNIERYYERYFLPDLKKLPPFVKWEWNAQKKVLKINNSLIDFRSADAPESIEGFGYKKIFLNEAGIILKDNYLYSHAILPMLLDYPDSQLIAAGVPKGKVKKDGTKHKFFELYENAEASKPGYKLLHYSSFDNPLLDRDEINKMINEMTEYESKQEIYGQFVDYSGNNPFAHQYKPEKHESESAKFDPSKQIIIHIDFNLDPFAVGFSHIWRDAAGVHDHQFHELSIPNGSIPAMIHEGNKLYGRHLQSALLTGDAMGNKKEIGERDNASLYKQLLRGWHMSDSQLRARSNPTHINSRNDVNYLLLHHPDFKINPVSCPQTCRDMRNVQCDAFGEIIKRDRKDVNQRADFLDCFTADTLIKTQNGNKPISEITFGESVLTSTGFNNVVDLWNSEADVYEFEFSDGSKINCTKDHKFYAHGFGFIPIYDIFARNISVWKFKSIKRERNSLNITEENISDILNRNISTSEESGKTTQDAYTGKCGSMSTARFQRALMFTTKMKTLFTMTWIILNLKKRANTLASICASGSKKIQLCFTHVCNMLDRMLTNGMEARPALLGTERMRKRADSGKWNTERLTAISAKLSLSNEIQMQDSVLTNADQHGGRTTSLTWKKENAKSAELNLKHENIFLEDSVQNFASQFVILTELKVKNCNFVGRKKVYDITVENKHEFFANEILVHNCVRYKINSFWKIPIENHQKTGRW